MSSQSTSSGIKTADALIYTGPGKLSSIMFTGTANDILTVYDNTSAAGTVIAEIKLSSVYGNLIFESPNAPGFNNGLYVDVTLAGSGRYIVQYQPE